MVGRAQHFDPLVERHQHFICENCDRVFDVMVDDHREIKPVKLPHAGFKVTSHQLAFYGTCKQCGG
jgi:Fe2+ or Zn2+ uptake regulation protein